MALMIGTTVRRVLRLLPRHRRGVGFPVPVLPEEQPYRPACLLATFGLAFVARPLGSVLFPGTSATGRGGRPLWWARCC